MADLTQALVARLLAAPAVAAIAGAKVHWSKVPQGTALPYVRLQVVSDPRTQHLKGYDAGRQTRVQADCFAAGYGQARTLALALIEAMALPAEIAGVRFGRTRAEGPRDLGEDAPAGFIHRMSVDLLIEHTTI